MRESTRTTSLAVALTLATVLIVLALYLYGPSGGTTSTSAWTIESFAVVKSSNPAEPQLELVTHYLGSVPITNLTASVIVQSPREFSFSSVTSETPLLSGMSTAGYASFFGGHVACGSNYNLTISGEYQTAAHFTFNTVHQLVCMQ